MSTTHSSPESVCDALSTQDAGKPSCEWCGQPYAPKRSWQHFCADRCRSAAWEATHPRVSIGAIKLQKGDKKPTVEQLQAAGFKVRRRR